MSPHTTGPPPVTVPGKNRPPEYTAAVMVRVVLCGVQGRDAALAVVASPTSAIEIEKQNLFFTWSSGVVSLSGRHKTFETVEYSDRGYVLNESYAVSLKWVNGRLVLELGKDLPPKSTLRVFN